MKAIATVRKVVKVREIPTSWQVELPGDDPEATVTVTISLDAEPSRRQLTEFIGAGSGVYATREEADAYLNKLRDEW